MSDPISFAAALKQAGYCVLNRAYSDEEQGYNESAGALYNTEAALRELAMLCERAEQVPEYLGEMNPSGAAEIVRLLRSGYRPPGQEGKE